MTGSTGIAPEDTPDHLLATGNQNEIEDGALMKILRHSITILYFKEFKRRMYADQIITIALRNYVPVRNHLIDIDYSYILITTVQKNRYNFLSI